MSVFYKMFFVFSFFAISSGVSIAQSNPQFVQLGLAKGALYKPDNGPAPHVAVLVAHRSGNFMSHIATRELSRRGFLVLGLNTRFENNEPNVIFEDVALDVRAGVEFLRKQPGITKVILFGHSGGGSTMTFYQAVAEKGPAASQGKEKIVQGDSKKLSGFPPADGVILADAHPGTSVNFLRALDAMLINEEDPSKLDPALDPFNPASGFNPGGPFVYTTEFKKKYHEAQSDRMNRLIDKAMDLSRKIAAGEHTYRDDDIFLVLRGSGGGLKGRDLSIHDVTVRPARLLKNDGTIVTRIIKSVREPDNQRTSGASDGGLSFNSTRVFTVRSFLSTIAIRSTNSIDGINWASANNSVPNNVQNISVPLLVTAMGAYSFIRDNEIHYEMAASADKEFIVIEGATHNIEPYRPGTGNPDLYSNVTRNYFDYVAQWINKRY
jgi:pimeloyl-ACP methyl ester carboxylesterase